MGRVGGERCDGREVEGVTGACASSCSGGMAKVENGIRERLGFGGLGEKGR